MRLVKISANKKSFRTVKFSPTGLNLILAKQKDSDTRKSDENKKGKTYNGVGKSLLIRLIHFCLGASATDYKIFSEKLTDWEFYLDFIIKGKEYKAERAVSSKNEITLNDNIIALKDFNKIMQQLCFDIPEDSLGLSFRSLLPFFIRPKRESYAKYDYPVRKWPDYQRQLYNAFLLGLDVNLASKKHRLKKEMDIIKKFSTRVKKDPLLKDFIMGNRDVSLTLENLNDRIEKLDDNLSQFKVAKDFHEIQEEADQVEKDLFALNNQIFLLENIIENINKSLETSPDLPVENITRIYKEAKINFPENVQMTLKDLNAFYKKLIKTRRIRLFEQSSRFKEEQDQKKKTVLAQQKRLDDLMSYLGRHRAIDLFVSLSNKSASLKSERAQLKKYKDLENDYMDLARQKKRELLKLNQETADYLKIIEPEIKQLKDFFRTLAHSFYSKNDAGLSVSNNERENQLRYKIEARIESDASDGISNVKIFCYDLSVLMEGARHHMDFIFHDSRLFDGIDGRQRVQMFQEVHQRFSGAGKQYIASINQDHLNDIKSHMSSNDEFVAMIDQHIILTLTDDASEKKLLGIDVELPDEE